MTRPAPDTRVTAVVFDLGGVLLDWNPRHLYRRLFGEDVEGMERFLAEVASPEWNARQDAGVPGTKRPLRRSRHILSTPL
jgi:2-haloacid dehalogenase